jgi:lysophospholipase L1-like esterase
LTKQTANLNLSKPEMADKIIDTITQLANNFDTIDASLVEKAKQTDVNAALDLKRDKTVKLELEDMSTKTLGAIAGNATFSLLSVPQNGSVTTEKTSFLNFGKNLFNKATVTLGYYVSNSTGQLTAAAGFNTSDYIAVLPNTAYSRKQSNYIGYFDANKVFISGTSASGLTFTTPANCYYIRITMSTAAIETEQVENGGTSTAYEPFLVTLTKDVNLQKESIPKDAITFEKTDFIKTTENVFDKNAIITGGYYGKTGTWGATTSYNSSGFVSIDYNKTYKVPVNGVKGDIAFWDKNKTVINGIGLSAGTWTDQIVVPNNPLIKYLTFPLSLTENIDTLMVAPVDNFPQIYIPFGQKLLTLKNNAFIYGTSIKPTPKTAGKTALIFGDSITETAVVSDDGATYTENTAWSSWVTYAKNTLQLGTVWNYAKSGASYKNRNLLPRQYVGLQISSAMANNRPADIIVVAAGTNDGVTSLGSYDTAMAKTTLESLDVTNLYEAIRWAFWTIRKNYPNAVCFAATPLQRATNEPLSDLNTAIIKMANRYNFIVIDAANESGIVRDFEVDGATGRYLADGLHPNTEGKKLMANLFSRVIMNSMNY